MIYMLRQRVFKLSSKKKHKKPNLLRFFISIFAAFLLFSCSEVTKLIPSNQQSEVPGLRTIDFTPTFSKAELLPSIASPNSVLSLQDEIKASKDRFSKLERNDVAAIQGKLIELTLKLNSFSQIEGSNEFFESIGGLPSASSLQTQLDLFAKSTPNLKTNLTSALQNEVPVQLVQRYVSQKSKVNSLPGFKLMETPESFYEGIATTFDPDSRPYSDIETELRESDRKPKVAEEKIVPKESYSVESLQTRLTYARSFQPKNAFQALVECAKVDLTYNQKNLSFSWPRTLSYESTDAAWGVSQVGTSKLQVEYRPSIALNLSSSSGIVLTGVPVEYEFSQSSSGNYANATYQWNVFDGAGSSEIYSLFHEAQKLFLFRLGASIQTFSSISRIFSSFQIPFGKLIVSATEKRSEFGLSRNDFSDSQKEFLRSSQSLDAVSVPPEDKWTKLNTIQFFQEDDVLVAPASSSETKQGGIHYVNNQQLADSFSSFFPTPNWRKSATASNILNEEDFNEITLYCKKTMD